MNLFVQAIIAGIGFSLGTAVVNLVTVKVVQEVVKP